MNSNSNSNIIIISKKTKKNLTFPKIIDYDADDALWVINDTVNQQQSSVDDNNSQIENLILSPSTNLEINNVNEIIEEDIYLSSGKWSVEKVQNHETNVNNEPQVRTLNFENINSEENIQSNETDIKKDLQDLKSYLVKTLTSLKYRIDGLETITQAIHLNIEKLIEHNNEIRQRLNVSNNEYLVDMDSIFPIGTENELLVFETLITDIEIRRMLISKLSLLITGSVGPSIRRILGRMFKDVLLQTYSLLGFKKKKAFSKIQSYRIIIDIIRSNLKFKHLPEKDIDEYIAIWLSHAKFRLKSRDEQ